MAATADDLLAEARAALDDGDYHASVAAVDAALANAPTGEGRFLAGVLHTMEERYAAAAREWQAAFNLFRSEGRPRRAARAAVEVARLYGSGLGSDAVARGWLERARTVLGDDTSCVEWGHIELARMACDRLDIDDLLTSAERAYDIAVDQGDVGLEARALADGGLALVSSGRTREGFARLDAALATITAGGVDADTAGLCFCSMLTACDRAGDLRRAAEWSRIAGRLVDQLGGRPKVLHTHCRVAYGSVLCTTGRWAEAEAELLDALGPDDAPTIGHRALAVAHLADLRIDQGRVDEAAELLAPVEDWVTSCGPLARVHRVRGDLDMAAAVLRRGLSEMWGDALRAAPLWASLVEVEVARGDLPSARAASDELAAVAASVDLDAVHAAATCADGRVLAAAGDAAGAREAFRAAKARLASGDTPMALGTVRLALAEVLAGDGDRAGAIAEARAAHACFERLGARPARDQADALLRRWGDTGRRGPRESAAALGALTRREREVLDAMTHGLTNAEIGERLYIAPKTVEHHVGRVLAKLGVRSRVEAAAVAVRLGVPSGPVTSGR